MRPNQGHLRTSRGRGLRKSHSKIQNPTPNCRNWPDSYLTWLWQRRRLTSRLRDCPWAVGFPVGKGHQGKATLGRAGVLGVSKLHLAVQIQTPNCRIWLGVPMYITCGCEVEHHPLSPPGRPPLVPAGAGPGACCAVHTHPGVVGCGACPSPPLPSRADGVRVVAQKIPGGKRSAVIRSTPTIS